MRAPPLTCTGLGLPLVLTLLSLLLLSLRLLGGPWVILANFPTVPETRIDEQPPRTVKVLADL